MFCALFLGSVIRFSNKKSQRGSLRMDEGAQVRAVRGPHLKDQGWHHAKDLGDTSGRAKRAPLKGRKDTYRKADGTKDERTVKAPLEWPRRHRWKSQKKPPIKGSRTHHSKGKVTPSKDLATPLEEPRGRYKSTEGAHWKG